MSDELKDELRGVEYKMIRIYADVNYTEKELNRLAKDYWRICAMNDEQVIMYRQVSDKSSEHSDCPGSGNQKKE
jgi:hypothetical protein